MSWVFLNNELERLVTPIMIPDEKLISNQLGVCRIDYSRDSYGYNCLEGGLIITNRRIIHVPFSKTGILRKTVVGFDFSKVLEINFDEISRFYINDNELILKTQSDGYGVNERTLAGFAFARPQQEKAYMLLSRAIMEFRTPKPIRVEPIKMVKYEIITKFEFEKDGALSICCPYCGGKLALQQKTGQINCSYCGRDAVVPTKILNLLSQNLEEQPLRIEKPFNFRDLATRLEKTFPTMVKLYEERGFIWVMDRVKVTEKGVVEGLGPAAEAVQRVYEEFITEAKS